MLLGRDENVSSRTAKVGVQDTEAGPLLPKHGPAHTEDAATATCRSSIAQLFYSDLNPTFARDAELAARAALFVVVTGLPFMIPSGTFDALDFVMNKGMYTNGVIIFFVYNLYKTSGETICNIVGGFRGTVLAVVNTWIMYFIFPGGVQEDSDPSVFWFGVANGAAFILALLWLNLGMSTKIFAISNFVFFWMAFLQPGADGFECPFTKNFEVVGNAGLNSIITVAAGGLLAIMATMFPYPLWALDCAKDTSKELVHQLPGLWRLFTDYLSEENRHAYQEDQVFRKLKRLETMSRTLEGHIQSAWWETLGSGNRNQVRRVLNALNKMILESYDRIFGMWSCSQSEGWGATHREMMVRIRPSVMKCLTEAEVLLRVCLRSALDGVLSEAEDLAVRKMVKSVRDAEAEFTAAFKAARESLGAGTDVNKTCLEDLRTEHIFGLSISGFCRMVTNFGEDLLEQRKNAEHFPKVAEIGGLYSLVDPAVVFDSAHLNSVLRSALSIFVGFAVGFFGYDGLISSYNAGIACTVSVLLSKFLGSAMVKNLGRVQGVVIGTVAGEIVHAIFGGCEWWTVSSLAICLFLYAFTMLFVYYNSTHYSYIGCLLGAFGCKMMLSGPCGSGHLDKAASYDSVISTVVAICLVMLFDLVLAPGRASDMAHKGLLKAWDCLDTALGLHFNETQLTMEFHKEALHSAIANAECMGSEAYQEPRYTRTEWKHDVYLKTIKDAYRMRHNIAAMEHSVAEGFKDGGAKSSVLQMVLLKPSFRKLPEILQRKMDVVRLLISLFVHETVLPFPALNHPAVFQEFRAEEEKADREFVDEVSADPMLRSQAETLEQDALCQICMVLGTIESICDGLRSVQHAILRGA